MTKINFVIDDVSEQQFRRAAFEHRGTKRGYLSGVLEEVTRRGQKVGRNGIRLIL
ncbi:MAG: hypothetical protein M3530_07670 [Thermoproteota archaeon]|nr:hypothetical protein [Thermoproteota archaeon]